MPFQISPAVNVREFDRTGGVPAVATTEAGLAGHFSWGPVQKRVLIGSEEGLVQQFWKPGANTYEAFFTAASFLSYSNALYVVRVVNSSTAGATGRNAHGNVANNADTVIKNDEDYENNYSTGISNIGQWVAKYPGVLGNSLKVSVCPSSNAWQSTLSGNLVYTANSTAVTGNGTLFSSQVSVGDLLILGPDKESRKVLSIASNTALTLETRYSGNTVTINATNSPNVVRRWEFYGLFDGAPGTSAYANTRSGTRDELHIAVVDEDGEISNVEDTVLERFPSVSLASDALNENGTTNYYKNVINQQSRWIWWAAHNTTNGNAGSKAKGTTFGGAGTPQSLSLVNGRDGGIPPNADLIEGYNKFSSTEDVDVSFILGGEANQTVATHLIDNIADVRKDLIVCLSPEQADVVNNSGYASAEMDDVIAFRNVLPTSSYATFDSGWKYTYDRYNDLYRYVPCNGDVAGLMARTDQLRDPWFSPAGPNRGRIKNVVRLAYNPKKEQRDQLYKAGINPLVTFQGEGTLLFGDKTMLVKPSAFDRINVRRLFIVLEKAISTAARFSLFEQNNADTRQAFKNYVVPFLRDVQGRSGIETFRVVCDETNNPSEVVRRNEFIGYIYVEPIYSINYITLDFIAVAGSVEFTERTGLV